MFQPSPELYPFQPRIFHCQGLELSYLDEGVGDPIVFVHGNPTWSFYFRQPIQQLRDRYRCIAPDHIGCGLSGRPTETEYDFSLKSRIDNLEALLDDIGVTQNITLFVQDWGGMIGLGYAARHPKRISRIIASNTGCGRLPKSKGFPWSLWLGRNTALGAWLILKRNMFCKAAVKWCVTRQPLPDDVKDHYLGPYDTPAHRLAVLKFVQTIPLKAKDVGYDIITNVEATLPRFSHVPTLLLWGLRDFVFDKHFLADWQKHFPHAKTIAWPDCGHYLLEDAPDEVMAEVEAFLPGDKR